MQDEEVGKSEAAESVQAPEAEGVAKDVQVEPAVVTPSEEPITPVQTVLEAQPVPEEVDLPSETYSIEPEPAKSPDAPTVPADEVTPVQPKVEETVEIPITSSMPDTSSVQPAEEATVVVQAPEVTTSDKNGIPQKVLDLTPDELDAARRLWASRTIHDTQKASVEARKERVRINTDRVEHFVKKYGPTTVRTVALELGMSTRSASAYLLDLANHGRLKATGTTTNRRYS